MCVLNQEDNLIICVSINIVIILELVANSNSVVKSESSVCKKKKGCNFFLFLATNFKKCIISKQNFALEFSQYDFAFNLLSIRNHIHMYIVILLNP